MDRIHILTGLLFILLALMFASCSVYYNTMFNAEKAFADGQSRPLTAMGRPSSQAIADYDRTIRKCGIVIHDYPKSKWVDDAILLMGKAMYYRGNYQVQALEKFEELLLFYPNSPLRAEATMYAARTRYALNQKDEAFETLRSFISNPENRDDHPEAMLLIADLYISEKNFVEAQHFLTLLIERFPQSTQYREGYLLLGKTYFDTGNYTKSLETFTACLTIKAPRSFKNDAMYYIAYSQFYLQDLETAYQTIRSLIRRENRLAKGNEHNISLARILAEIGRTDEAFELLEAILTNSPRTLDSAEAAFHIAEIYFVMLHDYEKAVEYFTRVRREQSTSPFIEKATTRSAVANQILRYYREHSTMSLTQLVTEQFVLAEHYLYEMAQPDSALALYAKIPQQLLILEAKIDSLLTVIELYEERELLAQIATETTISADSLAVDDVETTDEIDGVEVVDNEDEIDEDMLEILLAESDDDIPLLIEEDAVEPPIDIEAVRRELVQFEDEMWLYINDFIPRSYFVSMVIYRQFLPVEEQVQFFFNKLQTEYPDNRYAESAREFMAGERVTYLSREEKHQLARYDYAMSFFTLGDSLDTTTLNFIIPILDSLTISSNIDLIDKSRYTLGLIYFYDLADTLSAKTYLDTLLKYAPSSEYAVATKKFYDGENFIYYSRLPAVVEIEQREAERARAEQEAREQAEAEAAAAAAEAASENEVDTIVPEEANPPPELPTFEGRVIDPPLVEEDYTDSEKGES